MKSKKKLIGFFLILCCFAIGASPALAYVGEGPSMDINNSDLKGSVFISSSEIDYKFEVENQEDANIELERKFIGISLTKSIDKKYDIYGAVGYLFDGTLKPETTTEYDMDSGYFLSAGARYMMVQSGRTSFHIFGQLDYLLEEKYSRSQNGVDWDLELDGYELSLGGAIRYQINNNYATYAGISYVFLDDLSYDAEGRRAGRTSTSGGDVERDDNLGFKAGVSYLIDSHWSIRGEANFISDNAFVVSAGRRF